LEKQKSASETRAAAAVKAKGKGGKGGKKEGPRVKRSEEHIGKEVIEYLGIGVTKLKVVQGQEGFICLVCARPYHENDKGEENKWVMCRSCCKYSHVLCMENRATCHCGAQGPKNK
jgi:hypothetical protein